jgi:hypothetical protein
MEKSKRKHLRKIMEPKRVEAEQLKEHFGKTGSIQESEQNVWGNTVNGCV